MRQLQRSEQIVLLLVAAAVLVGGIAPTINAEAIASAIAYDGAAFAAAGLALVGAFRMPPGRRGEWVLIACGCFLFFVGDVIWDIYERVLHEPAPLPSAADVVYLSAYPLMLLGVLRLLKRRTDVDALGAWLDMGVLAMAVGLLVWEPLLVDSGRSFLGSLIAGAYPVFDIVLLGFAAALAGNRRTTQATLLVVGGTGALFIADLTYLVLESRGTYATGGFPDPLFVIGAFLLACAPWFDRPDDVDDVSRRRSRPLPGTAMVVAALAALPIDFGLTNDANRSFEDDMVRTLLRVLLLVFVAVRLLRQASKNERLLVDLDRTSTRLTTVIENTADAVVFVGLDGEILEWNATAERLFGFRRDEVIGTSVFALFERDENVQVAQSIMQSLGTGGSLEVTLDLEPQGQPMAVNLQVSAVTDSTDGVAGFVAVARDDTQRVLASHAMQSFAQLQPSDALATFAEELKSYVSFDTLSLASVESDRFVELARVETTGEGRDRTLTPAAPSELLHGPLVAVVESMGDRDYVILRQGDFGEYDDEIKEAGIAETIAVPLRDPDGEVRGLLGLGFGRAGLATQIVAESLVSIAPELARSVANMTLYARERQTAERLQELDDLREGFLALVAHEVRSPLGAIGTAASVLRDHGSEIDSDAARELAAGISSSARRLARLTGDLVDASRGGHGTFPCEMAPIADFGAIVHAAATNAAGGQTERLRICVADGVAVRGDADRLGQIVTNLVTNACKFSNDGIDVRLATLDGDAEMRVIDHGAGVAPAHEHRLFERYARLPHTGDGPRPSGSGLGLYITRELALAHGGDLWHEATPGGGATFVLRVPLSPEEGSA